MMSKMQTPICPYCNNQAQLVRGNVIYPHRQDLFEYVFWRCDPCDAHVGCHKPNKKLGYSGKEPLGGLANAELRRAKSAAHEAFDPLWRKGKMSRTKAYAWLAKQLGMDKDSCHMGEMDVETCAKVIEVCNRRRGL